MKSWLRTIASYLLALALLFLLIVAAAAFWEAAEEPQPLAPLAFLIPAALSLFPLALALALPFGLHAARTVRADPLAALPGIFLLSLALAGAGLFMRESLPRAALAREAGIETRRIGPDLELSLSAQGKSGSSVLVSVDFSAPFPRARILEPKTDSGAAGPGPGGAPGQDGGSSLPILPRFIRPPLPAGGVSAFPLNLFEAAGFLLLALACALPGFSAPWALSGFCRGFLGILAVLALDAALKIPELRDQLLVWSEALGLRVKPSLSAAAIELSLGLILGIPGLARARKALR